MATQCRPFPEASLCRFGDFKGFLPIFRSKGELKRGEYL